MDKKEALSIMEEILKMVILAESSFAETMHEYICDRLDISDQSLEDTLQIISEMKDE